MKKYNKYDNIMKDYYYSRFDMGYYIKMDYRMYCKLKCTYYGENHSYRYSLDTLGYLTISCTNNSEWTGYGRWYTINEFEQSFIDNNHRRMSFGDAMNAMTMGAIVAQDRHDDTDKPNTEYFLYIGDEFPKDIEVTFELQKTDSYIKTNAITSFSNWNGEINWDQRFTGSQMLDNDWYITSLKMDYNDLSARQIAAKASYE